MRFTVNVLCENTVGSLERGLAGEHGLSFYIEAGDRRVLYDTGQGVGIRSNADILGADLTQVDTVIISHGHYDHGGGLLPLSEVNGDFTLYGRPGIFDVKLKKDQDDYIDISIPVSRDRLESKGIHIRLDEGPVEPVPGITTTGEIPLTDLEPTEPAFFKRKKDGIVHDDMEDESALILDTDKGWVILDGCTHRGVIATLERVREITGSDKVYAFLGGLHLHSAGPERMNHIIDALKRYDVKVIGPCHCTGFHAVQTLTAAFPDRIFPTAVGRTFVA